MTKVTQRIATDVVVIIRKHHLLGLGETTIKGAEETMTVGTLVAVVATMEATVELLIDKAVVVTKAKVVKRAKVATNKGQLESTETLISHRSRQVQGDHRGVSHLERKKRGERKSSPLNEIGRDSLGADQPPQDHINQARSPKKRRFL